MTVSWDIDFLEININIIKRSSDFMKKEKQDIWDMINLNYQMKKSYL